MKKTFTLILRFSLSLALLLFLFSKIDFSVLINIIKRSNYALLIFAFFVYAFLTYLTLYRWDILLRGLRLRFKFVKLLVSFSGGLFFNLFLPTAVGGDIVRGLHLGLSAGRTREVISSVILDRLSGYAALDIIALIALAVGFSNLKDNTIIFSVSLLTFILIICLIFLFNKRAYRFINHFLHKPGSLKKKIRNLHREIYYFQSRPKVLAKHFAISVMVQLGAAYLYYLIACALGIQKSIVYFLIFVPIIGAFSMLPISVGGLGLRDMGAVFLFSKIGIIKEEALAISLLNFSFIVIISIIGGIIYVLSLHPRWLQHHKTHPAVKHKKTQR